MKRSVPSPCPASRAEWSVNILLCGLVLLIGWFYFFTQFLDMGKPARDAVKALASVLFVLCGLINVWFVRRRTADRRVLRYIGLLCCGQVLACAGDIVLNFDFAGGALLFAAGHVLFLAAFCMVDRPRGRDLAISLAIMAAACAFLRFYPPFQFGEFQAIVYLYAVIISCMLGKGVSLALDKELNPGFRLTVLLGSGLFFLSDLMLVIHQFASGGVLFDFFCLLLYYPAECCLALSVLTGCRLARDRETASVPER